ncbi:MAG TPA: NAD(P)-dependent alcohol dehydrogenase [Terriglobia bacterium]|nr:NAD(P)-dependent alcohol dehydrogenase [Terriglobia bacterium]
MKAVLYTKYGPPEVLELHDIEKPSPKNDEVLVRVHAASINALEWRRFTLPKMIVRMMCGGIREPKDKSVGADFAGHVEAVGAGITQYKPGDEVFGIRRGSFAEYVCAPEKWIARKPSNISFEAAAAVPVAALTALQALRDQGKLQAGQQVLIQGAGGGVGTFAVQIAKSLGAKVTAVCGPRNLDVVRSAGADHIIDYTTEDFTKYGQQYDLIVAANGYHSIFDYRRALKPAGRYVVVGGDLTQMFQALVLGPFLSRSGKKMTGMMTRPNRDDLDYLRDLIEAGHFVPVVDKCYPLGKAADAHRYVLEGHVRGKVILTI